MLVKRVKKCSGERSEIVIDLFIIYKTEETEKNGGAGGKIQINDRVVKTL